MQCELHPVGNTHTIPAYWVYPVFGFLRAFTDPHKVDVSGLNESEPGKKIVELDMVHFFFLKSWNLLKVFFGLHKSEPGKIVELDRVLFF